jgi:anti-anti-sigma factor
VDAVDEQGDRPRARLDVAQDGGGGRLLVRLAGELDLAGLEDVQPALDRLLARPPQRVVVDVAELEFLDSSGIAVLIRIANHFDLVDMLHARPAVRRVVEVLGLARTLRLDGA